MAVVEPGNVVHKKNNKSISEDDKRRSKIKPRSLMKAVLRPGGGDDTPSEGDQVIYHCTVRTIDGVAVESTRTEYGDLEGRDAAGVLGQG